MLTKSSVLSSASNKETIEMDEKTINHKLRSDRRKRSTTQLGRQIFRGTGMGTTLILERLVWPSFCSLVPGWRLEWRNKQTNKIKRKKRVISKEAVKNSSGPFKCHFGSQIPLKSIIQVNIQQMKPKLATKVSLITVYKKASLHNMIDCLAQHQLWGTCMSLLGN